MKRYALRHFIRYALWVLILLFPFCANFNTSLATGIGSVVSLDGDGDEVRVQHSQSLVLTDALTIEAWIHPLGPGSGGSNGGIIVNKEGEYELARFSDGTVRFAVSNADPGWTWISTGYVVPEGTWTHIAFTYSASQNRFQLFADGVLEYSSTGRGTIGDAHETHNYFKIGARREGSDQFFHGEIDEVRVWNIVRPESEIRARMNTSLQGNEPGLVGYWNFDDGTANDLSTRRNHGVLRGNAAIVPSTGTGQMTISAVPSTNSPAVGNTVEVAINIAGASNVGGYEFKLTFNPTQLQYISIENADFLPAGAFATSPIVASGSVRFSALALSGTGEGSGTLAIATFKVLAATRTTIELEEVVIADPAAQPLPTASVTNATISPTTSTTQTPVQTPTVPSTTTPTTSSGTTSTTSTGQLTVSAVPSVTNPAVGDTIEVAINIASGSNVGGYEFKLTFNPTQLQYISIENADFLPAGAFATSPIVASGSVRFSALALSGTGEGSGTLAIATFKVLAATRTTIGLEEVVIADPAAQPLPIASVTNATISPTASGTPTTPTTETQVTSPTVPSTTTPTTDDRAVIPIVIAAIEISAVPNLNNPAVGDTIEVSINIAEASNVGGYEFTLRFNPSELEFINIENADYLPPGTFPIDPKVESGSVRFAAAAVTGTGEGDGTLAVAAFRVLVDTATTIRFEHIEIGDQMAQPLGIASVTGATINRAATGVETEVEYLLSIPAGINLIHVPLKVTAVDGVARTIRSIANLYDALGGGSTVNFLITYDSPVQEWRSYFGVFDRGTPADRMLTDDTGILAGMKTRVSLRLSGSALGTSGNGIITLNPGLNVVGLPLRDSRVRRVSDLFALNGIGGNVPVIILTDGGEFKAVGRAGDPGDIQITGGQGFILTAQRPAPVIIYGVGWTNTR